MLKEVKLFVLSLIAILFCYIYSAKGIKGLGKHGLTKVTKTDYALTVEVVG